MDVNYSRWMSKDPDAEPDLNEEASGRRFSLPRPSRSVVASGAMVALIALGGAVVRSTATPEGSADDDQTVATTTADKDAGPGAASVEDATDDSTSDVSASDGATSDDWTSDNWTSDGSIADDSTASDEDAISDDEGWVSRPAPAGPLPIQRRMDRREFGPPNGMPPGGPPRGRAFRVQLDRP